MLLLQFGYLNNKITIEVKRFEYVNETKKYGMYNYLVIINNIACVNLAVYRNRLPRSYTYIYLRLFDLFFHPFRCRHRKLYNEINEASNSRNARCRRWTWRLFFPLELIVPRLSDMVE